MKTDGPRPAPMRTAATISAFVVFMVALLLGLASTGIWLVATGLPLADAEAPAIVGASRDIVLAVSAALAFLLAIACGSLMASLVLRDGVGRPRARGWFVFSVALASAAMGWLLSLWLGAFGLLPHTGIYHGGFASGVLGVTAVGDAVIWSPVLFVVGAAVGGMIGWLATRRNTSNAAG